MSFNGLIKTLSGLSIEELKKIKKLIDFIIKDKKERQGKKAEDRNGGDRFKANIAGSCIIERERLFFSKEYKITISDLSAEGVKFYTSADIIKGDFLELFFRSPCKGKMKDLYVKVVRVSPMELNGKPYIEVGAKSTEYKDLVQYRLDLSKGDSKLS